MMHHLRKPSHFIHMSVYSTIRFAWQSRRAWWFTATSRTRARFARTALGSFWLGVSNLLSIGVLGFVYGTVFKVPHFPEYFVYLGIGLTVWSFIAGSISSAPSLFESNSRNILNSSLNPIFYTLEEWSFQLQTFLQSFLVVGIALSFLAPTIFLHLFTVGLLPLLNLVIFAFWLPILICLLGARFHDVYQLVPIILQLAFLLSPILYKKASLGPFAWIGNINPPYVVLDQLRSAVIQGTVSYSLSLSILAVNIIGTYLALLVLERNRKSLPFLF